MTLARVTNRVTILGPEKKEKTTKTYLSIQTTIMGAEAPADPSQQSAGPAEDEDDEANW